MPAAQVVADATRSVATAMTRSNRSRSPFVEPRPARSGVDTSARGGWYPSPWAVFTGSSAFFSALVAVYWNASQVHFNDARYYVSLAEHPFHFSSAPFGFRILTPYLVWLTHIQPVYGFAAVTILSLATTAALLYLYLLEFFEPRVAMFGVAIFTVSPAALIELKWAVNVDSMLFAMVVLAFLALKRRRWYLLGTALVLGVLDKETMLFVLLPLAFVGFCEYRFEPQTGWVVLLGVPIVVYLVLHHTPLIFRPVPANYDYFSLQNLRFVLHEQQQLAGGGAGYSFFWSLIGTFGALWVLAALSLRKAHRFLQQTAVFVLPVLASVLLADNWTRMLALSFVVVIPLVCSAGLTRPVAAGVLLLSYDAIVSLGVKNLSGHAGYAIEIPLLLATAGAAWAFARPRSASRVFATASNGSGQALAGLRTARLYDFATTSNGASHNGDGWSADAPMPNSTGRNGHRLSADAPMPTDASRRARGQLQPPPPIAPLPMPPGPFAPAPAAAAARAPVAPTARAPVAPKARALVAPASNGGARPPRDARPVAGPSRDSRPNAVARSSWDARPVSRSSHGSRPSPVAPSRPVRSEPVEHLEAAVSLLADVQRLVAAADTGRVPSSRPVRAHEDHEREWVSA